MLYDVCCMLYVCMYALSMQCVSNLTCKAASFSWTYFKDVANELAFVNVWLVMQYVHLSIR